MPTKQSSEKIYNKRGISLNYILISGHFFQPNISLFNIYYVIFSNVENFLHCT